MKFYFFVACVAAFFFVSRRSGNFKCYNSQPSSVITEALNCCMNTDKVLENLYEQRHTYFVMDILEPVGGSPNAVCSVADVEGCREGFDAFFPSGFEGTLFLEEATAAAILVFMLIFGFENLDKCFHMQRLEQ